MTHPRSSGRESAPSEFPRKNKVRADARPLLRINCMKKLWQVSITTTVEAEEAGIEALASVFGVAADVSPLHLNPLKK